MRIVLIGGRRYVFGAKQFLPHSTHGGICAELEATGIYYTQQLEAAQSDCTAAASFMHTATATSSRFVANCSQEEALENTSRTL